MTMDSTKLSLVLFIGLLNSPYFMSVGAQVIEQITDTRVLIQGLIYVQSEEVLYFTDTELKTINRLDPVTGDEQIIQLEQRASFIFPVEGQEYTFLASLDRDIVVLNWDYDAPGYANLEYPYFTCLLVTVQGQCHGNRWNSGSPDAYGKLWAGTLTILDAPEPRCKPTLYRVDTTKPGFLSADVAYENFYLNGQEFTADNRILYVAEYYSRAIYAFNYDLPNGVICCPRVVFRYEDFNLTGIPDALTKDTDGNLWMGSFGGGQVVNINPNTGELLQTVDLPVSRITTIAFGGDDLDILYVGTMRPDDGTVELGAGAIFAVSGLGVTGTPGDPAVINSFCKPVYF